jgi:hypothetical protein
MVSITPSTLYHRGNFRHNPKYQAGYRSRGPGFDSRGPLSLVRIIEELLE